MKRQVCFALAVVCLCSIGVMNAQCYNTSKSSVTLGCPSSVDYFANNTSSGTASSAAPDATVRINNPGTTNGDLCAMVYVFDSNQELNECCGCITTPDGLRTPSVHNDLTSNPLTVVLGTGDIKIVSADVNGSPCDPTANVVPDGGLNAWATHIQNKVGSGYPITETGFTQSQLSTGELASLQADCYFTQRLGSGRGVCSCGTGD
jgi:hypothetical protein